MAKLVYLAGRFSSGDFPLKKLKNLFLLPNFRRTKVWLYNWGKCCGEPFDFFVDALIISVIIIK